MWLFQLVKISMKTGMSRQNNTWYFTKEWSRSKHGIKMQWEEEHDNQNNKTKHSQEPGKTHICSCWTVGDPARASTSRLPSPPSYVHSNGVHQQHRKPECFTTSFMGSLMQAMLPKSWHHDIRPIPCSPQAQCQQLCHRVCWACMGTQASLPEGIK